MKCKHEDMCWGFDSTVELHDEIGIERGWKYSSNLFSFNFILKVSVIQSELLQTLYGR